MDYGGWLRGHSFFDGIDDQTVRAVAAVVQLRQLHAGMAVFVEGMKADSMYFIGSGEVSLTLHRNGTDHTVGTLSAPETFGELSVVRPGPRRITARAKTDVALLEITRRDLASFQLTAPAVTLVMMARAQDKFFERADAVVPTVENRLDLAASAESARRGFFS
jgi:CRP-like cAMP-binding protein